MIKTEVLVAGEVLGSALDPITSEVLGKGHELANQVGAELSAVLLGDALSEPV